MSVTCTLVLFIWKTTRLLSPNEITLHIRTETAEYALPLLTVITATTIYHPCSGRNPRCVGTEFSGLDSSSRACHLVLSIYIPFHANATDPKHSELACRLGQNAPYPKQVRYVLLTTGTFIAHPDTQIQRSIFPAQNLDLRVSTHIFFFQFLQVTRYCEANPALG